MPALRTIRTRAVGTAFPGRGTTEDNRARSCARRHPGGPLMHPDLAVAHSTPPLETAQPGLDDATLDELQRIDHRIGSPSALSDAICQPGPDKLNGTIADVTLLRPALLGCDWLRLVGCADEVADDAILNVTLVRLAGCPNSFSQCVPASMMRRPRFLRITRCALRCSSSA
jgi:hypothetical protein